MATTNLVVLSSSPLRVYLPDESFQVTSSSPNFPSPGALLSKHPQARGGSQAVPIPKKAATFCLISTSLQEKGIVRHQDSIELTRSSNTPITLDDSLSLKKKTDDKLAAKDVKEKKSRKPRTKKAELEAEPDGVPKEKPAPKVRKKKEDGEGQTTIPKGKVTKAAGSDWVKRVSKKTQAAAVSAHFGSVLTDSSDEVEKPSANTVLLCEAVKRRTNWTPPKAISTLNNMWGNRTPIELAGSDTLCAGSAGQKGFTDLFGSFGYTKEAATPVSIKNNAQITNRKRKLIELVKIRPSTLSLQPVEKVKTIKKKPRTITGLATAAYEVEDEIATEPAAPLLQYFSHKISEGISESTTLNGFKKPGKPRSKITAKGAIKKSKSKKAAVVVEPLFSPESAIKRTHGQEFVFGTSSQLAREDSPTLLRDLHQAMLESNRIDEASFEQFDEVASGSLRSRARIPVTKKSLWSAASLADEEHPMDLERSGFEAEVALSAEKSIFESVSVQPKPVESKEVTGGGGEWFEIDENMDVFNSPVPLASNFVPVLEPTTRSDLPSDPEGSTNSCSDTTKVGKTSSVTSVGLPDNSTLATMPDFKSYSTFRLAKEIASYHFKPIKSRDQMISLMERCWQGKQRTALGALGPSLMPNMETVRVTKESLRMASTQGGSPKRARGRPQKISPTPTALSNAISKARKPSKSTKSVKDIPPQKNGISMPEATPSKRRQSSTSRKGVDEISDSDSPLTPSPPRRPLSKVSSPPRPLELSVPDSVVEDVNVALSPSSEQRELHNHITKAIQAAPPSTDPNNPSWHEKILIYDPIVLEDLTTWLNTGALQKVGWDGEVSPADVKKWCWKRSICCLWKVNLRGVARSRW